MCKDRVWLCQWRKLCAFGYILLLLESSPGEAGPSHQLLVSWVYTLRSNTEQPDCPSFSSWIIFISDFRKCFENLDFSPLSEISFWDGSLPCVCSLDVQLFPCLRFFFLCLAMCVSVFHYWRTSTCESRWTDYVSMRAFIKIPNPGTVASHSGTAQYL